MYVNSASQVIKIEVLKPSTAIDPKLRCLSLKSEVRKCILLAELRNVVHSRSRLHACPNGPIDLHLGAWRLEKLQHLWKQTGGSSSSFAEPPWLYALKGCNNGIESILRQSDESCPRGLKV